MPNPLTLAFPHPLNVSIQPTDILYTCLAIEDQAGVNHPTASADTKPFAIGVVEKVDQGEEVTDATTGVVTFTAREVTIERDGYESVWNGPNDTPPGIEFELTGNHFLFFSKDRRANMSGILGYYSLVEYRNYTSKQAEIFATTTEFSSSSK